MSLHFSARSRALNAWADVDKAALEAAALAIAKLLALRQPAGSKAFEQRLARYVEQLARELDPPRCGLCGVQRALSGPCPTPGCYGTTGNIESP